MIEKRTQISKCEINLIRKKNEEQSFDILTSMQWEGEKKREVQLEKRK